MHALIAQHGNALVGLAALRQHLEAQQNDEQTEALGNPVPHIDVPTEFNQDTSESAHECRNAYRENGVPGNVQSQPSHLKRYKSEVIIYVENGEPYNKQQHVHNLFLAITHYNCLETKTCQPQDNGIVEKWTQYVDSATRKCGSKNDWQN